MSWEEGKQNLRPNKEDMNKYLLKLEGHLDEQDAKYHLHNFLREKYNFYN